MALQQSRLGLQPQDVQGLVASVQDSHGSVEYRPFVAKLWGQLQKEGAVVGGPGGGGSPAGGAAPPPHLPQFVRARQRRLQTHVALALCQQPEATAGEAEQVAQLPGYQPWKQARAAQCGKRMTGAPRGELGRTPDGTFSFAGGDPQAAQVGWWRVARWLGCREPPPAPGSAPG